MAVFVDHKLKLTYEDLKQIPEDDLFRHEILDGLHVASPAPVFRHQTISRRIQYQLYQQIELAGLGQVVYAPADVELGLYDVVEPDIFVILKPNEGIITKSHVVGSPDLMVEILSPSTSARDLGIKKERYEAARVPEYWIIDPDGDVVLVYRFDRATGRYGEAESENHVLTYDAGGVGIKVDLTKVW